MLYFLEKNINPVLDKSLIGMSPYHCHLQRTTTAVHETAVLLSVHVLLNPCKPCIYIMVEPTDNDIKVLIDGLDVIKKRMNIAYLKRNPLVITALRNLIQAILAGK
jgi:hypothetical protein